MNPGGLPRPADTARSSEVDWDLALANAPTPLRRAGPPGGLDEMPASSAYIATTSRSRIVNGRCAIKRRPLKAGRAAQSAGRRAILPPSKWDNQIFGR